MKVFAPGTTSMTGLRLLIHEPNGGQREVPLVPGLTLGRHPGSGCVLTDAYASADHARVVRVGDKLCVEDLGSSNKTRIENGPVLLKGERYVLQPGVVIVIGRTRLEVIREVQEIEEPTPPAAIPGSRESSAPVEKAAAQHPREEIGEHVSPGSTPHQQPREPAEGRLPARDAVASNEDHRPSGMASSEPREGATAYTGTVPGAGASVGGLVYEARFRAAHPRLVIAHQGLGRIVNVISEQFTIGRRRNAEPDCVINHQGLSGLHARISARGLRFLIEDLGSTNGTCLGNEMIPPHAARELLPESYLRFGGVEAIFMVDTDADGREIDARLYDAALDLLVAESRLPSQDRASAVREAKAKKCRASELLLSHGRLSARDWAEAFQRAGLLLAMREETHMRRRRLYLIVTVILVVAALGALAVLRPW
ncbi:MAG: FHA domain-containing protein [Planctomycetota bacterium]